MAPVEVAARTTFITARAAVRRMIRASRGDPRLRRTRRSQQTGTYYLGGTQVAFDAIETFRRQLSIEAGRMDHFVTLSSGGVTDSLPGDFEGRQEIDLIEGQSLLGRAATLDEVGRAAAFAASDHARSMTAATLNVSAGALID